ncbi:MAG: peptidoglycan D,D-transpeptidase FtsI family protein [Marmoricola sp.]
MGSSSFRLRVALIVITMVLSVFGARLFQLQGIDPQAYAARAAAAGLVHLKLPAKRGLIVGRNGTKLARSVAGLMIVADPKMTSPHAEQIAHILADRLHLDYFQTVSRLSMPNSRFQYIARRVPSTQATSVMDAVDRAGYHGLYTRNDPMRVYPQHDVAANLVGFLGASGAPAAGLEQTFNTLLAGKNGHDTYEVGDGNRIPLGENTEVKPVNGKALHLTIDSDAQWYAQRLLRNAVHQVHAKSATAVALDSRTGQVLTLADYPTYDANKGSQSPENEWTSRGLADTYEPGSVEKVLTMSALINQGLVTPHTKLSVPGSYPVDGRVIHDYWPHGRDPLTLTGVIAKSSNIGTAMAAEKIGSVKMAHYLAEFGLGQKVPVGMPGQTAGVLPPGNTWTHLTHSEIAFGQGLSVNALQMAAAVNTVANHGVYVTPSLVRGRTTTSSGQQVGSATSKTHRVVSAKTASKVARMMEMVVTEGAGTAPMAAIQGYRVSGKTGTAQEVGGTCHCYSEGGIDVSFAGFAPSDKPRFTVYVVIKHPQGAASGGGTAGPVVRQLLSYLLQKYSVPPTGTPPAHLPVQW